MSTFEWVANAFNAASVILACLNTVHTWWVGIIGCVLFGWMFYDAKLYADVTLQVFFVGTSIMGWRDWMRGNSGEELPVRRTEKRAFLGFAGLAGLGAAGYGGLLHVFTDAYAPFVDSIVLAFSILGQLLLMKRRYETWYCWLIVNTLAVPLYLSRDLQVTAALYAAFWVNAWVALFRWRKLVQS